MRYNLSHHNNPKVVDIIFSRSGHVRSRTARDLWNRPAILLLSPWSMQIHASRACVARPQKYIISKDFFITLPTNPSSNASTVWINHEPRWYSRVDVGRFRSKSGCDRKWQCCLSRSGNFGIRRRCPDILTNHNLRHGISANQDRSCIGYCVRHFWWWPPRENGRSSLFSSINAGFRTIYAQYAFRHMRYAQTMSSASFHIDYMIH